MNIKKYLCYNLFCVLPVIFAVCTNSFLLIIFSVMFAFVSYLNISNTGSIKFRFKRVLVVIFRPDRGFTL